MSLTTNRDAFATGLASGLSQSEAFRHAYPRSGGWKAETVWSKASILAADPEVQARVTQLTARAAEANQITIDRLGRELARVAFGDRRALMSWGPGGLRLKDSAVLTDDEAAQIAEVRETTSQFGGSLSLKTHDKLKALELLGRWKGMFPAKVELTGAGGGPIEARWTRDLTDDELAAELAKYGLSPDDQPRRPPGAQEP